MQCSRVTDGVGTANPSRAPMEFCNVHVARSLVYIVVFCRTLFVLLSICHLAIVMLDCLQFTTSDYPFDILKLFCKEFWKSNLLLHILHSDSIIIIRHNITEILLKVALNRIILIHNDNDWFYWSIFPVELEIPLHLHAFWANFRKLYFINII